MGVQASANPALTCMFRGDETTLQPGGSRSETRGLAQGAACLGSDPDIPRAAGAMSARAEGKSTPCGVPHARIAARSPGPGSGAPGPQIRVPTGEADPGACP